MIPVQAAMYGKIIARETIKGFKAVCSLRYTLGKRVYPPSQVPCVRIPLPLSNFSQKLHFFA